jgi:hypothetical protein
VWILVRFDVNAQKCRKLCEMGIYSRRTRAVVMPQRYGHAVTKFGGRRRRGCVPRRNVVAAMGVFGAMSCA